MFSGKGDLYPGAIHPQGVASKNGAMKVIKYKDYQNVYVEFISTGYRTKAQAGDVRRGRVKDLMLPSVYGVGFIGGELYSRKTDPYAYNCWRSMMQRCYCEKSRKRMPTYENVTVCNEWHNFQNFAEWYYSNHPQDGEVYDLDKDKLSGSEVKIYSPDNCVFIGRQENVEVSQGKEFYIKNPEGKIIKSIGINRFSRENDLHPYMVRFILSGDVKHHKGWTKPAQCEIKKHTEEGAK